MGERKNIRYAISLIELDVSILQLSVFGMEEPGGRLNKKDGLTRYGNSHVKDKTS